MAEYEEHQELPLFWSWIVLIIVSFSIIGYGMIAMFLVREPPRRYWDHGSAVVPPGLTIYTTEVVKRKREIPPQIGLVPIVPQYSDTISNVNTFSLKTEVRIQKSEVRIQKSELKN
jgi:hypothetical protein